MAVAANDEAPASTEPVVSIEQSTDATKSAEPVKDPAIVAEEAKAKAEAAAEAKKAADEAAKNAEIAAEEAAKKAEADLKAAKEAQEAAKKAAELEANNANKAKIEAAQADAKAKAELAKKAHEAAVEAQKIADDAQTEADKLEGKDLEKDVKKDEAGFFASASSKMKAAGMFAVGMVNPMGWYAAGSAAVSGVWNREFKATGETLWNDHRPAVAGMSVTAILVAAELYDNLVSKAFNKAKAFVEEQLS